tara:strand:- start:1239 stop:1727 length:489 start_codon:yes stop_codon:yes gene_type:complete
MVLSLPILSLALLAPLPPCRHHALTLRPSAAASRPAVAVDAAADATPQLRYAAPVEGGRRHAGVRMQEAPFWQNVERFARFAISAVAGLILTLLSPFAAFARSPFLAAIGASIFVGILAFIYITLTSMQAPLSIATSLPVDVPTMGEASMKTMLDEIYGGSP